MSKIAIGPGLPVRHRNGQSGIPGRRAPHTVRMLTALGMARSVTRFINEISKVDIEISLIP
ncbi:MAG: hypothetical protein JW820_20315 [Spirochaetales bacterium]|nr:hypothetical protein [Spirochaetales bacterium]